MKKTFRKALQLPLISTLAPKLARWMITSDIMPKPVQTVVLRWRNSLPRKIIIDKIALNAGHQVMLELNLNSYGDREIFYRTYEPAVVAFYQQIVRHKKVIWDIGSYIGLYVVMAGLLLKGKGEVFAFEPVPPNFKALRKNVELNGLRNVHLFNVALSSEDGEAEIYLLDAEKTTSSPSLDKKWAKDSGLDKHITVKTRSANSLLSKGEVASPDLIKIDAETHEPVILRTIQSLLMEDDAPDILCELMPPIIQPLTRLLLDECGYDVWHVGPECLEKLKELEMRRPYNDYFFTKNAVLRH